MGEEFVKKLRPLGCAVFLLLGVLMIIVCLTAGRDPIKGYAPPQDTAYWAEHPEELLVELREHVFPELEGVLDAHLEDGTVVVEIASDRFAVTRSALLQYFDRSLLAFARVESG